MPIRFGVSPIAWVNDDMPELGGDTRVETILADARDIGFAGVLRPDHVPTVEGDSNVDAGYSSFGRLYALGYIRGLRQAVYATEP